MELYKKYRPSSFDEVVGNEDTIQSLKKKIKDKSSHTFLLYGKTGCGKTTIGRIIANELGCRGLDLKELNSADFRGIDTVRAIRSQIYYAPSEGSCRVWLIDECHSVTKDGQEALLKMLEDTPKHVFFILCTTKPQMLLPEIKGRCSKYEVKPLDLQQTLTLIRRIVKAEGATLRKNTYENIFKNSEGHPRNAIQILDKVLSVDEDRRTEVSLESISSETASIELCRALLSDKPWKTVATILTGLKNENPENVRRHVLRYCNTILLKGEENNRAALIMEQFEPTNPYFVNEMFSVTYACYCICH